jgi:hypothetical protein
MKVISGDFGQKEGDQKHPYEYLTDYLDEAGLSETSKDSEFLLLWDSGDASNFTSPGDVMMIMEKARTAIMMANFGPHDDSTAS